MAAGPGSVVKLTAGKFYTNEILVDGFDGCFKGAGMHRTVVDTLRGLDSDASGVKPVMDPDDETGRAARRVDEPHRLRAE